MCLFKRLILLFLAISLFLGCNKDDDFRISPGPGIEPEPTPNPHPAPEHPEGVKKPVGKTVGTIYSFSIGAGGGEVVALEGKIKLQIPPGALQEEIVIGVQEIENTNDAGIGTNFRLTPHGQEFLKPVSITLSYKEYNHKISAKNALGIAFQDDEGVWNYVPEPEVDMNNKTVSVKTTHFSDWGAMQWMWILPMEATVETGGSIELEAVRFLPISRNENDLIVPLVPPSGYIPVGEPISLEEQYLGKWELSGGGVLESLGSKATYYAPASVPAKNPVAVSMKLNTSEELAILVSNITVEGGGIEFRINGGEWIVMDGVVSRFENNNYAIASVTGGAQFSLHWKGGEGLHNFTYGEDFETLFQYYSSDKQFVFLSTYETEEEYINISGGGIHVNEIRINENFISGTFTVKPSGQVNLSKGEQEKLVNIEGRFKVKKGFGF